MKLAAQLTIAILVLAVLGMAATAILLPSLASRLPGMQVGPPLPAATPPPPTILAPAGARPAAWPALTELAQYAGQPFSVVGSGFLLAVPDADVAGMNIVVGVTTAHSVGALGQRGQTLERLAFVEPQGAAPVAEFEALIGPPGIPRTNDDLSVDYVLLLPAGPVDAALVLPPDPRGGPQVGERVLLFSGRSEPGSRPLAGTVLTAEASAAWVLMDSTFEPGGLSGSPLLSAHTGQVVGMAIAAARRGDRLLIGLHPIASLVARAQAASSFPAIAGYQR